MAWVGDFHYDNGNKNFKERFRMQHCLGTIESIGNCFMYGVKRGERIQFWKQGLVLWQKNYSDPINQISIPRMKYNGCDLTVK